MPAECPLPGPLGPQIGWYLLITGRPDLADTIARFAFGSLLRTARKLHAGGAFSFVADAAPDSVLLPLLGERG